jgi:REase_DpnII-MboI
MAKWTQQAALDALDRFCHESEELEGSLPNSSEHIRWFVGTTRFLQEVFGEVSLYFANFKNISWVYRGPMQVHMQEVFIPGATEDRYNSHAFPEALDTARGLLLAAKDELIQKGVDEVYKGKDTGPETSLILRIMNLAEMKLRKTLRTKPEREREVQDAFENLLIGADIPYSRETDSIEYSSKTYKPDFTVQKADLAIEIKLCATADHEKDFIAQINDDILAYSTKYGNLFFVVYDCGFIRDTDRFGASFESQGAVSVRVVKH